MQNDTHLLIPKDKFDIETANRLNNYSYEQIKSIIPNLLTWIQDMNWPVSRPISNYLQTISEHLTEEIIDILKGKDEQWKYWVIHVFGIWSEKEPNQRIINEILRIATNPSKTEIEEEVQEIAIEFIDQIKEKK